MAVMHLIVMPDQSCHALSDVYHSRHFLQFAFFVCVLMYSFMLISPGMIPIDNEPPTLLYCISYVHRPTLSLIPLTIVMADITCSRDILASRRSR